MSNLNKVFILLRNFIIFSFIIAINAELKQHGGPFADLDKNENGAMQDSMLMDDFNLIFPGTKWCGPGDIAENYNDLGEFRETDMCCRAHDNCDDLIFAGEEKHGLKNDGWFTSLHCKCDREFFNCLHDTNNTVSDVIGTQYFFFRDRCYMKAPLIIECVAHQQTYYIKRCLKYSFNTSQREKYQWFELPLYDTTDLPNIFQSFDNMNLNPVYRKLLIEQKLSIVN